MRVLVVPEFYRPDEPTANGTVNDAIAWIREWLDRDGSLHVYLLVPTGTKASSDADVLRGDRDRVTVVEAAPPASDVDPGEPFTDTGYSAAQLRALREAITDPGGYVDVVVDQLRFGRETLYKLLLEDGDHWAATVRPFDIVANVHDLQVPPKYRYCAYRNDYQFRMEAAGVAFCDGVWFTAGVDADAFEEHVDFLAQDVVEETLENALVAGAPIDFDRFDERYAERPQWLHLAGSFWAKKNVDRLFAVARGLYEAFGIRTLLTSVEPVPGRYREPGWVEAHGEATEETYERALERGDLAVHASDYETMPRTPIEQAAAGQVLVLPDERWARECVPDGHPLLVPRSELARRTRAAVEAWDESVRANRRLVAHAREYRGTVACGRRTYRDLRRRVDEKTERNDETNRSEVVANATAGLGDRFSIDTAIARTARHTREGRPLPDLVDHAFVDVIYALRALGYADVGNPGTPVFERT